MRNLLLALFASTILYSCTVVEQDPDHAMKQSIQADDDFSSLIDISKNVMAGEFQSFEELNTEITPLIEALDAKFIAGHTPLEQDIFKEVFMEEVFEDQQYRLPVIEFGTSHAVFAPIEDVWQTLVAVESYPEWNPFTPMVETTFEIGSPITMHVRLFRNIPDLLSTVTETVVEFSNEDQMCWVSIFGSEFWLKTHRCYVVNSESENETILESTMHYEGLLAPLTNFVSRPSVFDGFNDVAVAMKERLE